MRVFVAGPYSQGNMAHNVKNAIEAGDKLLQDGHFPYIPHLTHFQDMMFPRPYKEWLALDKEFLQLCDCVLRIPGESFGADQEVEFAKSLGIPVYTSIDRI